MPRCRRCGDEFVRRTVSQIHCISCATEVAALIAADDRRRAPRFVGTGKDLTGALR
jgi:hypothetical protein